MSAAQLYARKVERIAARMEVAGYVETGVEGRERGGTSVLPKPDVCIEPIMSKTSPQSMVLVVTTLYDAYSLSTNIY